MYEDLEYYEELVFNNVLVPSNMVNINDVYDAIERLKLKQTKHVFQIGVDEKAILMQELRSQLLIILQDAMGVSNEKELAKLNYIVSINIIKHKFTSLL